MLRTTLLIAALTLALAPARAAEFVTFSTLFKTGSTPSPKAEALAGREVELLGFMAPSLKIDAPFFVLVKSPMDTCPFCSPDATWPDQLAVVYLTAPIEPVGPYQKLLVRGTLELGAQTDPDTGLTSHLRLRAAQFWRK